ncbi:hypothetical protein [Streptomyces sp. GESEQ-35]|uniref:hypothetical protein n=1 Tax=Streptomyces sp. GESEQ-35 TaxID=2812657 RepID=UPI001B336E07|nr:hypothetical protein [Streptomyces sp. GESEQ-35]
MREIGAALSAVQCRTSVSSLMTLALNVTDPLLAGQTGKAAFDAVGPLLLIRWAEVGPGLLQSVAVPEEQEQAETSVRVVGGQNVLDGGVKHGHGPGALLPSDPGHGEAGQGQRDVLLERARQDEWHRQTYQRPISAETLRRRLHIGAARSRMLVSMVRSSDS